MADSSATAWMAGVISGITVYALNKLADRFLTLPRLVIEPHVPWTGSTFTTLKEGDFAVYQFFNLVNKSIYVAKNCRVYVLPIRTPSDKPIFFIPQHGQLRWKTSEVDEKYKPYDLPKGLTVTFEGLEMSGLKIQDDPDAALEDRNRQCGIIGGDLVWWRKLSSNYKNGQYNFYLHSNHNRSIDLQFVALADNAEPYYLEVKLEVDFSSYLPKFVIASSKGYYQSRLLNFWTKLRDDFREFWLVASKPL